MRPLKAMALTLGSRLAPYEVTALIGQGGMGEVCQARDRKLPEPRFGHNLFVFALPDRD